jgi:transcriptional antiterminator NusG
MKKDVSKVIEPLYPSEPRWYVVYVRSRTEKKVASRMERAGLTHYLPLMKVMKQWSDRKKLVEVPMFNGYMFVQTTPSGFNDVRMVEGVVNFVRMEGKNAIIPDRQLEAVRIFAETGLPVEAGPDDLSPGEKVKVTFGPLKDFEGELVEMRNDRHFLVRLEAINQVLMVNIPSSYIERAG